MKSVTKRLIRDERGLIVDPEADFRFVSSPVPEVPRDVLASLLQPGMIPAYGNFEPHYAPITETAPAPPGVYRIKTQGDVSVIAFDHYPHDAAEPEPINASGLIAGIVCWLLLFAAAALCGWFVLTGQIHLPRI
jgi:hypothetical protein